MTSTAAHAYAVAALSAPRAGEIAKQLPAVGRGLADALEGLANDPSASRAGLVLIQLSGALRFIEALREALAREGDGRGPHPHDQA